MSTNQTIKTISQADETQQVTIRVPEDLHRAVKIEAINRKATAQDIWIAAVRKYLKLHAA
jgi:hypothetical protein